MERLWQLRRIALAVAFAHHDFLRHNNASRPGRILGLREPGRASEDQTEKRSPCQAPEQGGTTPDQIYECATPCQAISRQGQGPLRWHTEFVGPEEELG